MAAAAAAAAEKDFSFRRAFPRDVSVPFEKEYICIIFILYFSLRYMNTPIASRVRISVIHNTSCKLKCKIQIFIYSIYTNVFTPL